MRNPTKKDFDCYGFSRLGGYVTDLPKPYVFLYPKSTYGRRIEVVFSTFRGFSLGAKHWYASIKEEDNPISHAVPHPPPKTRPARRR